MKKIIGGKVYNTETATHIGTNSTHLHRGDFAYEDEDLYVTKKGAFFLQGEGGPMSRWSQPCGSNGCTGGSGIQALGTSEALEWCEQNDVDPEVIAEHFKIEEA